MASVSLIDRGTVRRSVCVRAFHLVNLFFQARDLALGCCFRHEARPRVLDQLVKARLVFQSRPGQAPALTFSLVRFSAIETSTDASA